MLGEQKEKKAKRGIRSLNIRIGIIGGLAVVLIIIVGTLWMGQSAKRDIDDAVHSVSSLYLNELAGRREKVVEKNLNDSIDVIHVAVDSLTENDLKDVQHLQAFQKRMKAMFHLEKFAFVDTNGLIYTSTGTQQNIDNYEFHNHEMEGPEISVLNIDSEDKKVIIAVPIDPLEFEGETLVVCFMEKDMEEMFEGVSMESNETNSTFCNIYSSDGTSLSNIVLSGQADVSNLFAALENAEFEKSSSLERLKEDFAKGISGSVTFTFNGIQETLTYAPVEGTDWMLTYLIRESVIGEQISSVSKSTIIRSIIQSVLTTVVLLSMFAILVTQNRNNAKLTIEKEKSETENRVKQEELEEKQKLQKELEEALKAAEQANKAKTVFLSNMSHEIRTPMNAIIGLNSIILNDPEISETTRQHSEKIGASANHMLGIINDILDMSRIESGRLVIKKEEFSFPKMLEQINTVVSGQCREKGLSYECRLNGKIDDYYIGDDVKLRQVFINVLGNAVKFTPEGGTVSFYIEDIKRYEGNDTIRFTIKDTGIGMSEEYLPHLFDTFSQEDSSNKNIYGSTGLGMPITKNIVELMNGTIDVESKKGVGTTFVITITLTESERTKAKTEPCEIEVHEMSVLVIDDDPIACEHATVVLGQVGVNCDTVTSGEEAIESVRIKHGRMDDYNLILVDWKMPGMDGVETTRKIREIVGPDTPIIILTSYNWDEIVDEAKSAGVDTFVSKPLFAWNVLDEFREAFRKKNEKMLKKNVDLKGKRVLLAEDMEVNAEIMEMVLDMREIIADVAENGQVAVDLFQKSEIGYYDAILMDMRMPVMDGLEATRVIRSLERDDAKTIPIIALTANAFDEDVQRSLQAGLNAHLSKPVVPDALFETMENLLG